MDKVTREFLDRKFNAIDEKFLVVHARLDGMATKEELREQQQETRAYIDANLGETQGYIDAKMGEIRDYIDSKSTETRRQFEVIAEGLRSEIRQVAEDHQIILDGQARIMDRLEQVEWELGAMIKFSYAGVD